MKPNMTAGLTVLAGVALFEAALIPGIVIGAAAILAPKYLPKRRWRFPRLFDGKAPQGKKPGASSPSPRAPTSPSASLAAQQALVKTITFRVIVTTLDFGANYWVIGELATAAGLSAFSLAAGPFFYFVHEIGWNKYGKPETAVDISAPKPSRLNTHIKLSGLGNLKMNRAVAKTITYRTFATTMDFTTNYVAVGDIATAAGLSAFGFVLGPFVYLGHELAWDRYGWLNDRAIGQPVRNAFQIEPRMAKMP
jgi:uncharacterized membrane protein